MGRKIYGPIAGSRPACLGCMEKLEGKLFILNANTEQRPQEITSEIWKKTRLIILVLELVRSKHYTRMERRGFAELLQGNMISTSFKIDLDILDKSGIKTDLSINILDHSWICDRFPLNPPLNIRENPVPLSCFVFFFQWQASSARSYPSVSRDIWPGDTEEASINLQ